MFVLKKSIWSKYPYGPARTRPHEYTHTVGPYACGPNTRMVWNMYIYNYETKVKTVMVNDSFQLNI